MVSEVPVCVWAEYVRSVDYATSTQVGQPSNFDRCAHALGFTPGGVSMTHTKFMDAQAK